MYVVWNIELSPRKGAQYGFDVPNQKENENNWKENERKRKTMLKGKWKQCYMICLVPIPEMVF